MVPQIPKVCKVEDNFRRNNFPFGKKFKFLTELELKIQESKQNWIWFEFKRGSNLLGKIP
jgi:hypothetical protein